MAAWAGPECVGLKTKVKLHAGEQADGGVPKSFVPCARPGRRRPRWRGWRKSPWMASAGTATFVARFRLGDWERLSQSTACTAGRERAATSAEESIGEIVFLRPIITPTIGGGLDLKNAEVVQGGIRWRMRMRSGLACCVPAGTFETRAHVRLIHRISVRLSRREERRSAGAPVAGHFAFAGLGAANSMASMPSRTRWKQLGGGA